MNRYKLNDRKIRILGIPLVSLIITFGFHSNLIPGWEFSRFFMEYLVTLLFSITFWEGNRYIFIKMRNLFPEYSSTGKRLVIQTLFSIIFTASANVILCFLLKGVVQNEVLTLEKHLFYLWVSLFTTLLITIFYECYYFFDEWKRAAVGSEKLKRQNLISQFETLKNQVNPHFLFNSLNTLITIIPEDTQLAVEYVQKLSKVYRYVLQLNDKKLIELQSELTFIKDYIFLNKIRFGENLQVNFNIPEGKNNFMVAPLTIQMLIENAIKHNVISTEKPLIIDIYVENNDVLVIKNNLQKKISGVESTRIGLQNLITRYKFLTQKMVNVIVTTSNFMVTLPLLEVENHQEVLENN
ncbi:MAG: histidine kinase [Bacteroidota bacterium]|nr:histidine kinase [Bacteroidota bacterium]